MDDGPASVGQASNSSRRVVGLATGNLPMNGFALNNPVGSARGGGNEVPAMGMTQSS